MQHHGWLETYIQALHPNSALTLIAVFPTVFWRLISTNMDVFRREELHNLSKHIFEKSQSRIVSCAIDVFKHTPLSLDRNLLLRA